MSKITNTPNINLLASSQLTLRQITSLEKVAGKLEKLIAARHQAEKLEAELKSELKDSLKPAYFGFNENVRKTEEVNHTFDVGNLQVNFVNSYIIKDKEHAQILAKLLGGNHPLLNHIQESQKITVDVTSLGSEDANKLAGVIAKTANEYGVRPQVERKTTTTEEFHNLRHVVLTQEDNQALDEVLPMQVQVALIE